jgi:hypothetical protein
VLGERREGPPAGEVGQLEHVGLPSGTKKREKGRVGVRVRERRERERERKRKRKRKSERERRVLVGDAPL